MTAGDRLPENANPSLPDPAEIAQQIESIYRQESRRVLATLIRFLRDVDLAEDALQEAFAAAAKTWPQEGVPRNPRAWLVSAGRFRAVDALRKRQRFEHVRDDVVRRQNELAMAQTQLSDEDIEDDRLRLIFTCCHPAIAPAAQVALTLREVCGLTTDEIASAFLAAPATIAQRIVRARSRIRDAGIPYRVPEADERPERLQSVLSVIYLVYSEGYAASAGQTLTRTELTTEAIRLGRLVVELMPDPEAIGLLALMLLQESRRQARTTADGDLILLDEQDRSLWDQDLIREGTLLVAEVMSAGHIGGYSIQAALAAQHAIAATPQETDWGRIVVLYDSLLASSPSPVVELNRAVAVAMRDGPAAGLDLITELQHRGELQEFHLLHAAQADLLRRDGKTEAARDAYLRALALARQEPERRFLRKRIDGLSEQSREKIPE
ncbi:MAG: RNA polymerase sigma factor [Planctomycetaceae bacterium]